MVFPAGWGQPALHCHNRVSRGRGGVCPARDITVTQKYRVIRRGGINAARCNHPGNATQRSNSTGRFLPFFWVDFLQICINYNRFVIFDGQPAQRTNNLIRQYVCRGDFFPFLSVKFHLVFSPLPVYYNNCQRGRTSTRDPQKNHCKKKEKQL